MWRDHVSHNVHRYAALNEELTQARSFDPERSTSKENARISRFYLFVRGILYLLVGCRDELNLRVCGISRISSLVPHALR